MKTDKKLIRNYGADSILLDNGDFSDLTLDFIEEVLGWKEIEYNVTWDGMDSGEELTYDQMKERFEDFCADDEYHENLGSEGWQCWRKTIEYESEEVVDFEEIDMQWRNDIDDKLTEEWEEGYKDGLMVVGASDRMSFYDYVIYKIDADVDFFSKAFFGNGRIIYDNYGVPDRIISAQINSKDDLSERQLKQYNDWLEEIENISDKWLYEEEDEDNG